MNGSPSSEVLLLITIGKHELFIYLAGLKHCLSLVTAVTGTNTVSVLSFTDLNAAER